MDDNPYESRILDLEIRVEELEQRINATRLVSRSFFVRMFAVLGYFILGYLICAALMFPLMWALHFLVGVRG